MVRAVRGATTVENNEAEEIIAATRELLMQIIEENDIIHDDVIDILFTVTPDLTAVFPARAARQLGYTDIALLDMAAPDIDGALKKCIRALIHFNTEKSNKNINPVYMRGAKILRPDIVNKKHISVAIDGPAGAGKSSVSKAAAKQLGFVYIDTGAMYRAVALYAVEKGIDCINEKDKLIRELNNIDIEIKYFDDAQHVFLCGRDVSDEIRKEVVSVNASNVAVIPEVRRKLVAMQQDMARRADVIMDGRDICSYVLPNAQVKIFLTASSEARALRRYNELILKGTECDFEELKRDIEYRDKNDSERAESPLKKAPDALLLDTTNMTFEESVKKVTDLVKEVQ